MDIRPFETADAIAVGILLDTVFEGSAERRLTEELRATRRMASEMVATDEDRIVGYIGFTRMVAPVGWLSLSPVAVTPALQGQGVGAELVRYGLDRARQSGALAVTVLGSPDYYTRFGFTLKAAENLNVDYPKDYFLLYPIAPGTAGLATNVIYPSAFQKV